MSRYVLTTNMHLSLPVLLSLLTSTTLALPTTSNTTLALPTTSNTTTTTPSLEKRTKPPWIGAFANPKCTGPVGPNVQHDILVQTCYKYKPVAGSDWIGINYGSGAYQISELTFYTDDACTKLLGPLWGFGTVFQGNGGSGMQCRKDLGAAKSFMAEQALQ